MNPSDPTKDALARLAKAESLSAEAQRIVGVGTWEFDSASGLVIWSTELFRMFGVTPDSFKPSLDSFLACVHPGDRTEMVAVVGHTLDGNPMDHVFRIVRPTGEVRHIHGRAQAVALEKDGAPIMLGTCQDITERWQAEQTVARQSAQLRDMQAKLVYMTGQSAMGTMAATLAHELNQPLAVISNYAEALMHTLPPEPQTLEGLESILKSTEKAGAVIRHLRIMTKRSAAKQAATELNQIIENAVDLLTKSNCWEHKIECRLSGDYLVKVDAVQIGQVIISLLKNSCEAVQDQPVKRILIETSKHDERIKIAVSDSGAGIPPEAIENLFEARESEKPAGLGVELSVSRTIVESHGGRLEVKSLAGAGSCFWFTLPCARPTSDVFDDR